VTGPVSSLDGAHGLLGGASAGSVHGLGVAYPVEIMFEVLLVGESVRGGQLS
jgi:hypothetical protein